MPRRHSPMTASRTRLLGSVSWAPLSGAERRPVVEPAFAAAGAAVVLVTVLVVAACVPQRPASFAARIFRTAPHWRVATVAAGIWSAAATAAPLAGSRGPMPDRMIAIFRSAGDSVSRQSRTSWTAFEYALLR